MTDLINGRTPEEIKRWISSRATCNTCPKEHETGCEYGERTEDCQMCIDALAYIERLEAQQPKWSSVKDKLPDAFISVLVQMPGEAPHPTVREGFITHDGIWSAGYFKRDPDEVTHWMPLPKAPEIKE